MRSGSLGRFLHLLFELPPYLPQKVSARPHVEVDGAGLDESDKVRDGLALEGSTKSEAVKLP